MSCVRLPAIWRQPGNRRTFPYYMLAALAIVPLLPALQNYYFYDDGQLHVGLSGLLYEERVSAAGYYGYFVITFGCKIY